MRYLKVTGPVRQKDGSERLETQYVKVSEAKGAPAFEAAEGSAVEPVRRLPRAFERWEDGGWVTDEAAKRVHEEDARLNRMTQAQRQEAFMAVLLGLLG